jgi:hypothetical protein
MLFVRICYFYSFCYLIARGGWAVQNLLTLGAKINVGRLEVGVGTQWEKKHCHPPRSILAKILDMGIVGLLLPKHVAWPSTEQTFLVFSKGT